MEATTYTFDSVKLAYEEPADEPWVQDLRAEDDPSLTIVPAIGTWEDLQYWFGLDVLRGKGWDATPRGHFCFKLVGFYIRTGVSAFIPKVLDVDGNPMAGVRVAHTWPGAPVADGGEQLVPDYAFELNKGVAGWTNLEGDVGFGYSHGMMIPVNGPGVGRIWPMISLLGAEPQYADAAINLGWTVNTDHLTANPVFQLVEKLDAPTPPQVVGYMVLVVNGEEVGRVEILPLGEAPNGTYVYFKIGDDVVGTIDF